MSTAAPVAVTDLRQAALACCVVHDVDVEPRDDGVVLDDGLLVGWPELLVALGGARPSTDEGRARVAGWLLLRRLLHRHDAEALRARLRPQAFWVQDPWHPGMDWTRSRVLGDVLDLGPAFVGLDPDRPDDVLAVPQAVLVAAGVADDVDRWWVEALDHLAHAGRLAAERFVRRPEDLRPVGSCDVLTLLASGALRRALVAGVRGGLRAVAVPDRTRGWTDLRRVDPAYVRAVALVVGEDRRGLPRPVLVAAEEVALAADGGHHVDLRDPAPRGADNPR